MPKVILLYREPVSRSRSFFYEKKKKNMTKFNCVEDDMKSPRQEGLWWEYYYDNIDYFDNYIALESYFTEILAINYHYFSRNQLKVMGEILKFINIDKRNFDGIELEPVNSSKEAILTSKMHKFRIFRSYLPGPIEKVIGKATRKALRYCTKVETNDLAADIRPYLQNSLSQYEKFRDYIKHEDVVWLRKSL